jgi:DNA-binding GntR family transcriptional regulator
MAYRSIKEQILAGRMDGDARLTEESLATQLGISKSPIREALNRLEAEGLIDIVPRKGAHLRRLSAAEIWNLYDLREALETHVIRTAKLTPELFFELHHSLRRQRAFLKVGDRARYIEEDVRFHDILARSTGNSHLVAALENLHHRTWLSHAGSYDLSSATAPDAHKSIVDALERGDREGARSTMRDHIRNVRQCLVESLNLPWPIRPDTGSEPAA